MGGLQNAPLLSRSGLTTAALTALVTAGCSGSPAPDTTSATPAASPVSAPTAPLAQAPAASDVGDEPLAAVVLPDLANVAAPVRAQLQAREATLRTALANPTASVEERAARYGQLGDALMAAAFFDDARLCYRHAATLVLDEARWPYLLGHATLRKGDRRRAALAFARAVTLEPAYLPALVWLGEMQLDLGQDAEAQATFGRAVAQSPNSAAALFGAGRAAVARGSYGEAVSYLEQALRADPKASVVHYPLAMAYRRVGAADKAAPLLQRRGTVAPLLADPLLESAEVVLDSAVAHEAAGMQALRAQDWTDAVAAFRRGLTVAPDDASLRYWMASAMIASGDAAGAEREFREVLRRHPGYANAHFSLGAIMAQRGQRAEALAAYKAAVRYAPTMPDARLRLADTLRAAGQLREAFAQYDEAVRLDPKAVSGWVGGAETLLALGDTDQARDWLTRARQVHPSRRELDALSMRLEGK